jgi:hypothetical protein
VPDPLQVSSVQALASRSQDVPAATLVPPEHCPVAAWQVPPLLHWPPAQVPTPLPRQAPAPSHW